jgi:uracil-DNA glycosylase
MLGKSFRITKQRGTFFKSDVAASTVATFHPSAILRAPDREERNRMRDLFVKDLKSAHQKLNTRQRRP